MKREGTHIGIVACSAEGAALCYRTICNESQVLLGEHRHPEISMHTFNLGRYMDHVRTGAWDEVGALMVGSAEKLASSGAAFAVCPDNTIHEAFTYVKKHSPIPFIHIAEAVGEEAKRKGFRKLAISGTKYLMTSRVYPDVLDAMGIEWEIPDEGDRQRIDAIIFKELVNGIFDERSRSYFNTVYSAMAERGCDAAVLGCTEIPLLVDPGDCPLPVLDSTRLLARSAIRRSIGENRSPTNAAPGNEGH